MVNLVKDLPNKMEKQQKSFEQKMADFAVKMDTKLNEMSERLGQELHGVKDAVAMLQEGEQSALKIGEKVETLNVECTKFRDFERRIGTVIKKT